MRREHAEQQPVGAGADVLVDRDVRAAQDVEHELGLLDRAAEVGHVGVERRHAHGAVPLQPRRQAPRRGQRRRRVRAADGRQQRVHAPRPAAAVHVLRQRARVLPRDRRDDVPRAIARTAPRTAPPRRARGRSRAAPRAAAPRRPRGRRARAAPPGRSRAGSARPRAAPPRRRPRSGTPPRRRAGTPARPAAGWSSPSSSTAPSCSSPVAIGTSATTPGGTAAARERARSPTYRRSPARSATGPDAAAAPRRGTTIATTPPVSAGGQRGHALESVAAQDRVHHPQVHGPDPLHHGGPAIFRLDLHRHVQYASFNTRGGCGGPPREIRLWPGRLARRPPARRPLGGPAGSPRRTRPCESGRPPRRAG